MRKHAPHVKVMKMQQHCAIAQARKRLIMSNVPLDMHRYDGKQPTLHEVIGPSRGWDPEAPYLQKDAWNGSKTTRWKNWS